MQEIELDDFWNRLSAERVAAGAATSETETVVLLTRLPMPEPRAGFLNDLWISIEQSAVTGTNGNLALDASDLATTPTLIPVPMPTPVGVEQRRPWARIVAAVAGLVGQQFAGKGARPRSHVHDFVGHAFDSRERHERAADRGKCACRNEIGFGSSQIGPAAPLECG